jgi:hypothetical protein
MLPIATNAGWFVFQQIMPSPQFAPGAYVVMPGLETLSQQSSGLFEGVGALAMGARLGKQERNKKRRGRNPVQQANHAGLQEAEEVSLEEPLAAETDSESEINAPWQGSMTSQNAETESQSTLDFIQSCRDQLDGSGADRKVAISSIRDHVLDLAFGQQGCRLVQAALEKANQKEILEISDGLRGHVGRAVKSPNANYVLQKIVEILPTTMASFVADELLDIAGEVARHRYGCRIICRLLEHAGEASTDNLVDALLREATELSGHAFGNIVMRSILEHGSLEQRARVADALRGHLEQFAKRKHGSFVVEKALASCDDHTRFTLANELLQDPPAIARLAQHQFGHHIVTELARAPGDCSERTLDIIHSLPRLASLKHGKRCLKSLGMHYVKSR